MEFYNPGGLPDDISIDDLMSNNYSSRPRNKQIADTFKEMGEIEKYGSGVRRVIDMCVEYGLPKPQWKQNSGGILVTVWKDGGLNGELNLQNIDNEDIATVNRGELNGVLNGQLNDQLNDHLNLQSIVNENVTRADIDQLNGVINGKLNVGELNDQLNGVSSDQLNGVIKIQYTDNQTIVLDLNDQLNGVLSDQLNGVLSNQLQRAFNCISRNQGCNLLQICEKINVPYHTVEKHIRLLLAKGLIVRKGGQRTGGYFLANNLNETEERTIAYIKENRGCNLTQISEALNVPFDTIKRHVNVLVAKNFIERRGSKKTGGYYLK